MSLTKIGSIGINTGIQFAGITTVSTLKVGSGVTLSSDGDIFATGVTTATSFVGDGSGLTGVASTENIRTNTNATFLQNINVSGSTTTGSLVSSGAISGTTGTFTGNVAVSGANITLQDSGGASDDRVVLGAGSDLQLYHDGNNSYLKAISGGTGDLYIFADGKTIYLRPKSGEDGVKIINDGAVELYHNGTKKIETKSTGSAFSGLAELSGTTGTNAGGLVDLTVTTGDNFIKFKNTGDSTKWAVGTDSTTREHFDFWYDGGSGYSYPSLRIQSEGILAGSNTEYPTSAYGYNNWQSKSQILHSQGLAIQRSAADTWGGSLILAASNGSYQNPTAAASDDKSGGIYFCAHDGTDFSNYASAIETYIDGAVSGNDTPGRLVFSTAADGSNQLSEALRLTSDKIVNIAGQGTVYGRLNVPIPTTSGGSAIQAMNTSSGSGDGSLTNIVLRSVNSIANNWSHAQYRASSHQFQHQGTTKVNINSNGLCFNSDTASANALDDYEEGTWTPALKQGGGTITSIYKAIYTKVGRICHIQCYIAYNGAGNNDAFQIQGLPYTILTDNYSTQVVDFGRGGYKGAYSRTHTNSNYLEFLRSSEATGSDRITVKGSQIGAGYIIFSNTYMTA